MGATWIAASRYPFERYLPRQGAAPRAEPAGGDAPAAASVPPVPDVDAASVEAPRGAAAAFSLLGAPRLRRLLLASLLASASWDVYQFVLPLHAGSARWWRCPS